jgi:hypothetical protein
MPQRGRRSTDQLLLMALACGATVENAAVSAGISQATVYRRLKDPEFQQELCKTKTEMVNRTAAMLTAAAGEAVKTLLALQKDSTPPASRLGAARAVLELGVRIRESAELEGRIAVLESRLAENRDASSPAAPCPPASLGLHGGTGNR